jgi:hypothetical protein
MKTQDQNSVKPDTQSCQMAVSGSVTPINANAICLDCGTAKENPKNGFCINDHDNWLEETDEIKRFSEASVKFYKTASELMFHIQQNVSITDR